MALMEQMEGGSTGGGQTQKVQLQLDGSCRLPGGLLDQRVDTEKETPVVSPADPLASLCQRWGPFSWAAGPDDGGQSGPIIFPVYRPIALICV